jgi:hypothetical protein
MATRAVALLRARHSWPRGGGAADQSNELTPFQLTELHPLAPLVPCQHNGLESVKLGGSLHCGISIWLMSAWGQKRRLPHRNVAVRFSSMSGRTIARLWSYRTASFCIMHGDIVLGEAGCLLISSGQGRRRPQTCF